MPSLRGSPSQEQNKRVKYFRGRSFNVIQWAQGLTPTPVIEAEFLDAGEMRAGGSVPRKAIVLVYSCRAWGPLFPILWTTRGFHEARHRIRVLLSGSAHALSRTFRRRPLYKRFRRTRVIDSFDEVQVCQALTRARLVKTGQP